MANDKLTYQELEKRNAELKKQNEFLLSNSKSENLSPENHYKFLFENSPDGFAYHQMIYENNIPADYIFLEVNPAFEKITGLKNVKGRKVTDVIPDIKEKSSELFQIYGSVATTGIPQKFEIYFSPFKTWFSVSAICPEKGYFIAIFDDITERKKAEEALKENEKQLLLKNEEYEAINEELKQVNEEYEAINEELKQANEEYEAINEELKQAKQILNESEEKHRFITENINDIIWKMDVKTLQYTYVSPSIFHNSGYTVEEFTSLKQENIFTPASLQIVNQKMSERLINISKGDNSAKISANEYQMVVKDGSAIWFESIITYITDDSGNVIELIGVSRNIEDRKKVEEALKESEKQLRELNDTKNNLFSIIAHDLRSPFTSILGFSELLSSKSRTYNEEQSKELVGYIYSSAKQTLALLDNLLSWAKTQTDQINFKPVNVILQPVVQEIVEVLNLAAKSKDITLNNIVLNEIEVYADLNMLMTVLRNLISNAIKFTNTKGKINIYAFSAQNQIEITVSDNGVGMNEEIRNKLFKKDIYFTTRGTKKEKGTGLGLLLCQEFAEKHGGKIWVESEEGKGSEFKFTLPLCKE